MHIKILEEVGKFLDGGYVTHYSIEGYYGFVYLTIPVYNHDKKEFEDEIWRFDVVNDEVIRELIES